LQYIVDKILAIFIVTPAAYLTKSRKCWLFSYAPWRKR